jgi:RNA polymerase sigma factor (TIGR02999 family)
VSLSSLPSGIIDTGDRVRLWIACFSTVTFSLGVCKVRWSAWYTACSFSGAPMSEVTRVLAAIEQGDPHAAEQLLPLVYDELRTLAAQRLAREAPGQTLQATALVHEAYLRLVNVEEVQQWNSRGHFFAAAAEAMRRILLENARRKKRIKHGGDQERVEIELASLPTRMSSEELLALD